MRGLKALAFGAAIATGLGLVAPQAAEALVFGNSRNTPLNQLVTNVGNAAVGTSGWYGQGVDFRGACCNSGFHFDFNTNYAAGHGFGSGDTLYQDFWVCDISTLTGSVTSASFQVFTYAIDTTSDHKPSVTLDLYDVMTPISDLVATNSNRGDIFGDLGSGTLYGTHVFDNTDSQALATISLSPAMIADLNLAIEAGATQFVIGGALVPEPSPMALLGLGLVALTYARRRGPR